MLISFLLLKLIQEYVLGEYDDDATIAYHENSTSEFADDDHHVKDTSRRCCTKISSKFKEEQHSISGFKAHLNEFLLLQISCPLVHKWDCM